MNIVKINKVEDCFDGSAVFDYCLSEAWNETAIRKLTALGELEYFADFPRPLFRLHNKSGLFVNGLAGECQCRVILPHANREQLQSQLQEVIESIV